MKNKIIKVLKKNIDVDHIRIFDESYLHRNKNKLHIKVIIVTKIFYGISLIERHKIIHKIIEKNFYNKIYALDLYTYCTSEWIKKKFFQSKKCINKN
ncbi:BolA/IbaG family iron-sulfur metabolism protein [Buchnera aphidicola (Kurisakia onigurumii)]|uniref:BolA family protein n=1 Tax=Buchnera aphidicola TaxID=9 RepID=UPI0031B6B0DD